MNVKKKTVAESIFVALFNRRGSVSFILLNFFFWSVGFGFSLYTTTFNRNMQKTRETSSFCYELLVSHAQTPRSPLVSSKNLITFKYCSNSLL